MATIHFILQGKGGVGKSMVAVMLCQALRHFGKEVIAFDTDPVNATLAGFKEFNVTSLDVMQDGNINPRKFDQLLEALVTAPEDSHVVVDNGASSFIALGAYLSEADVLSLLAEEGTRSFSTPSSRADRPLAIPSKVCIAQLSASRIRRSSSG